MSVYDDIRELARSDRLREELYSYNEGKKTFNYNTLTIPAFFNECYLSDRYNGSQFVINLEFATVLGYKITKQAIVDKMNYSRQDIERGVYSLVNAVDEIIKLSDGGFDRNTVIEQAFRLCEANKAELSDYASYKFDPDSHSELENFLKRILRTFNQVNAFPETCKCCIISAKNGRHKKYINDIIPINFYEGIHLKDKLSDYRQALKSLVEKGLVKSEYLVFDEMINKFIDGARIDDIVWDYIAKSSLMIDLKIARDYSKEMKDYKYHALDFEVFKHDWLVVVKELKINDKSQFEIVKEFKIVNDPKALVELSKDMEIVVGFNNKFYDNHILNAIIYSHEFAKEKVDLGQPFPFTYTQKKRLEYYENDGSNADEEEDFGESIKYFKADDIESYDILDRLADIDNFFQGSSGLFQLSNAMISRDESIFTGERIKWSPYLYLDTRNELALGVSLKKIEANLGLDIRESTVPFTIDRKLTEKEIEEVLFYCNHDVTTTIEVLNLRFVYFKSLFELCEMFELNDRGVTKTRAALTAEILGCRKKIIRYDRLSFGYIDFLKQHSSKETKERYSEIYGNYSDNENRIKLFNDIIAFYRKIESMFLTRKKQFSFKVQNYKNAREEMTRLNEEFRLLVSEYEKMALTVDIAGVEHKLKFGGIHGAIPNYIGHGTFLSLDVTSYYPYLMVNNNWVTRNTMFPERVIRIINRRVELKRVKDPQQQILKIVINSLYGVLKAETSAVCDAVLSNNVCVNGQLALANLVLRLSHVSTLIQSNTDGIIIETSPDKMDEIREIYHAWEKDFNFNLEEDEITDIYQRDVNNYLVKFKNGEIKAKGRYSNIKKINFEKNDKRCIDLSVKAKFEHLCEVMNTDNGSRVKYMPWELKDNVKFDYRSFLMSLAYRELTAFQILCVQGSTFDSMIHKLYLYPDATGDEKTYIQKIIDSPEFVRRYREPEDCPYETIEYRLQKVNRGIMTKKRMYGQVYKLKAGVIEGKRDYTLDGNGKPVINSLGEFVYNSYSASLIPDISKNVMILNDDVRNFTKEQVDELEIDFDYYVNLVSKNDILNSGVLITSRDIKKYPEIWELHSDTTTTTVTKSILISERQICKRFDESTKIMLADIKSIRTKINKMYNTASIENIGVDGISENIEDIRYDIERFKGTYLNDFETLRGNIEKLYSSGKYLAIPETISDSVETARNRIDELNSSLHKLLLTCDTFKPVKTLLDIDVQMEEFMKEVVILSGIEDSKERKTQNKKVYEMFKGIKEMISKLVKEIETFKKDFIKNDKDRLNISNEIKEIKELAQTSFLGDSDVINEMFENSLLVKGLFSSDIGALMFLNINISDVV